MGAHIVSLYHILTHVEVGVMQGGRVECKCLRSYPGSHAPFIPKILPDVDGLEL